MRPKLRGEWAGWMAEGRAGPVPKALVVLHPPLSFNPQTPFALLQLRASMVTNAG